MLYLDLRSNVEIGQKVAFVDHYEELVSNKKTQLIEKLQHIPNI